MSPLSPKASELITGCVQSNDMLLYLRSIGDTSVQIGNQSTSYQGMKEQKELEAAIQELVAGGYIEDRAGRGEIFFPTPKSYGIGSADAATQQIARDIVKGAVSDQAYIRVDLFHGVGLRVSVGDEQWGESSPEEAISIEVAFRWLLSHGYVERRGARGDFYEPTHLAFTTFGE